jgi:hypothetical protein
METLALVLFAVAALGGLFLAVRHFRQLPLPLPVSLLHGALAAAGLIALIAAYLRGSSSGGVGAALALLVVAALGGFALFSFHLRGRRAPSAVVVIHALVAVSGFLTLLAFVL